MDFSYEELMNFIDEEDVKFIRLAFSDINGKQKNISIMPGELERAFRLGGAGICQRNQKRSVFVSRFFDFKHSAVAADARESGANVLRY